jgi:hypothetical protein
VDLENKELIAEVSDFGKSFNFERVYPDACDEGVKLMSHRTGVVSTWTTVASVRDQESEMMFWILQPDGYSIRKQPALEGWMMRVFND